MEVDLYAHNAWTKARCWKSECVVPLSAVPYTGKGVQRLASFKRRVWFFGLGRLIGFVGQLEAALIGNFDYFGANFVFLRGCKLANCHYKQWTI